MKPGKFSGGSKHETITDSMTYALLVQQSQEHFDKGDKAAGRAYDEALQTAGVFVGGVDVFGSEPKIENEHDHDNEHDWGAGADGCNAQGPGDRRPCFTSSRFGYHEVKRAAPQIARTVTIMATKVGRLGT